LIIFLYQYFLQSYFAAEVQAEKLLLGIWGVGPALAHKLVHTDGLRSIADARKHRELFTQRQLVGLDLYEELQQRIPRREVEEISLIVRQELSSVAPGARMEVCGSYRRGKETCGDIDILISHDSKEEDVLRDQLLVVSHSF
jgi:DNA polymerase/3'-5' exonuclease PolX